MSQEARRLLQLQQEFAGREQSLANAIEFNQQAWAPRSEEAIEADYDIALRAFIMAAATQ